MKSATEAFRLSERETSSRPALGFDVLQHHQSLKEAGNMAVRPHLRSLRPRPWADLTIVCHCYCSNACKHQKHRRNGMQWSEF